MSSVTSTIPPQKIALIFGPAPLGWALARYMGGCSLVSSKHGTLSNELDKSNLLLLNEAVKLGAVTGVELAKDIRFNRQFKGPVLLMTWWHSMSDSSLQESDGFYWITMPIRLAELAEVMVRASQYEFNESEIRARRKQVNAEAVSKLLRTFGHSAGYQSSEIRRLIVEYFGGPESERAMRLLEIGERVEGNEGRRLREAILGIGWLGSELRRLGYDPDLEFTDAWQTLGQSAVTIQAFLEQVGRKGLTETGDTLDGSRLLATTEAALGGFFLAIQEMVTHYSNQNQESSNV